MRGYAIVALHDPKNLRNVGGVFRAAACYGLPGIVLGGSRLSHGLSRIATDTTKTWRHTPLFQVGDVLDFVPFQCATVAIEYQEDAIPLPEFRHPERAYYIFGAEDRGIPGEMMDQCNHVVSVPTDFCMNLAATVNVVLYDRLAKQRREKWAC